MQYTTTTTTTTTTSTVLRLSGFCPGQPWWAGIRRNIHPLTPTVLWSIINHLLSVSSIYYDPWHPPCSIYVPDSLFAQSHSKFSLVYLLAWHSLLHAPYISSLEHCLLFCSTVCNTLTVNIGLIYLTFCGVFLLPALAFAFAIIIISSSSSSSMSSSSSTGFLPRPRPLPRPLPDCGVCNTKEVAWFKGWSVEGRNHWEFEWRTNLHTPYNNKVYCTRFATMSNWGETCTSHALCRSCSLVTSIPCTKLLLGHRLSIM